MPELAPVMKAIFCARSCDMRASVLFCVQWRVRLRYAILSYGPVLIGESALLRALEHIGEVVSEAQVDAGLGGGLARKTRVLDAERHRCAGMLGRIQNRLAVVFVKLRLEQRAVDCLMEERRRYALRFRVDEGLGKRLDHGGDHEIAAKFECVRLPGVRGDNGEPAADGLQQRPYPGERIVCAGGDDPQV